MQKSDLCSYVPLWGTTQVMNTHDIFTGDILYTNETKMTSKPNALCNAVGQQNIIWFWYRGLAKVANNNWWHHWAVFEKYQ